MLSICRQQNGSLIEETIMREIGEQIFRRILRLRGLQEADEFAS